MAEMAYYQYLETLQRAGVITHFLWQVPFHLPGSVRYRLDFMVFYTDGNIDHVDIKGMVTAEFKIKKKQVEALYPVRIRCLKKKGNGFEEFSV